MFPIPLAYHSRKLTSNLLTRDTAPATTEAPKAEEAKPAEATPEAPKAEEAKPEAGKHIPTLWPR